MFGSSFRRDFSQKLIIIAYVSQFSNVTPLFFNEFSNTLLFSSKTNWYLTEISKELLLQLKDQVHEPMVRGSAKPVGPRL